MAKITLQIGKRIVAIEAEPNNENDMALGEVLELLVVPALKGHEYSNEIIDELIEVPL